jgi:hypothetical protein
LHQPPAADKTPKHRAPRKVMPCRGARTRIGMPAASRYTYTPNATVRGARSNEPQNGRVRLRSGQTEPQARDSSNRCE